MSPFQRRCRGVHCGYRLLGISSFNVRPGGGRSYVCKSCEATERDVQRAHEKAERLKARLRLNVIDRQLSKLRIRAAEIERERLELRLRLGRSA